MTEAERADYERYLRRCLDHQRWTCAWADMGRCPDGDAAIKPGQHLANVWGDTGPTFTHVECQDIATAPARVAS